MVTDFICVCLYVFLYIFFADVVGEGVEKCRPPRLVWLVSGQKEMVASVLSCLVWANTQGISHLNATSTIHLFIVGWQMGYISNVTQILLKCLREKGNFSMLTNRKRRSVFQSKGVSTFIF